MFPSVLFAYDLKQMRLEFDQAVNDADAADAFYKKLKAEDKSDPIVLAYFGSAEAVRAKHAWSPYHKISYLKSGLKNLGNAIDKSPSNLEIRFLRFSLEHYIPSFLGYSKHLDIDRKRIIDLIQKKQTDSIDKPLLNNIIAFMKESNRCTAAEIAILDKAIKNG